MSLNAVQSSHSCAAQTLLYCSSHMYLCCVWRAKLVLSVDCPVILFTVCCEYIDWEMWTPGCCDTFNSLSWILNPLAPGNNVSASEITTLWSCINSIIICSLFIYLLLSILLYDRGNVYSWMAPWKNRIYWYISFFRPSLNRVLFLMFCLLVEGECQILVF